MDKFISPKIYKKESVKIEGAFYTGQYYCDNKGRDWYETLTSWNGAIALDESDIVCACESDVSMMGMQEGRSVYEVLPRDVPENVVGNYTFKDGVFTDIRPNDVELAESERKRLMQDANNLILPLQDAADLGIETEGEASLLFKWKQYRVLLSRVDISAAPNVEWPVIPE
jgi:hypothetical protein